MHFEFELEEDYQETNEKINCESDSYKFCEEKMKQGGRIGNAVGGDLKDLKQAWGRAPRLSTQCGITMRPEQQGALYLGG